MIVLVLHEPPSKNRLYSLNRKGFTKSGRAIKRFRPSDVYKAWMEEAWVCSLGQPGGRQRIDGPYSVRLEVSSKSNKDADGMLVPILDFLVKRQITPDDKQCMHPEAVKLDSVAVGTCRVIIEPWVAP
jgi:hypothetical protein